MCKNMQQKTIFFFYTPKNMYKKNRLISILSIIFCYIIDNINNNKVDKPLSLSLFSLNDEYMYIRVLFVNNCFAVVRRAYMT